MAIKDKHLNNILTEQTVIQSLDCQFQNGLCSVYKVKEPMKIKYNPQCVDMVQGTIWAAAFL